MLDIGWSEIAVIGIIVLIVVGPKDLPRVLRTAGQWMGKARKIAREFQTSIDDMIRDSELDEVRKDVESATKFDVKKDIENAIDPKGDVKRALEAPAADADETGAATTTQASSTPSAKVAPEPKLPAATATDETDEPKTTATDKAEVPGTTATDETEEPKTAAADKAGGPGTTAADDRQPEPVKSQASG